MKKHVTAYCLADWNLYLVRRGGWASKTNVCGIFKVKPDGTLPERPLCYVYNESDGLPIVAAINREARLTPA